MINNTEILLHPCESVYRCKNMSEYQGLFKSRNCVGRFTAKVILGIL